MDAKMSNTLSLSCFVQGIGFVGAATWLIWWAWDLWPILGSDILAFVVIGWKPILHVMLCVVMFVIGLYAGKKI